MKENKQTTVLPLFPLRIFLLPGEKRTLHIFEQRYKNLFNDILYADNLLGIPYFNNGKINELGTIARLEKIIRKYISGEFDVIIKGESFFNTINFYREHSTGLYPFGEVEILKLNNFQLSKNVKNEFEKFCKDILNIEPDKYPVNSLLGASTLLGLLDWEKYELISDFDESKINLRLSAILKFKTQIDRLDENIIEGFSLN